MLIVLALPSRAVRDADAILADPRATPAKLSTAVEVLVRAITAGSPLVPGSLPLMARLLFEKSLPAPLRRRMASALARVDHLDIPLRAVRGLRSADDPIDVEVAAAVLISERHIVHVREDDVRRLRLHAINHSLTFGPVIELLTRLSQDSPFSGTKRHRRRSRRRGAKLGDQ